MQNRYKRIRLDEIYCIAKRVSDEAIQIRYPLEIKLLDHGIGIKMISSKENVVICMYPDHLTSQISVTRKGIRYLFSKRDIRLKKCTFEELMHTFQEDDRLFGITRMIELYFIELIKLEHPEIIESVYLS